MAKILYVGLNQDHSCFSLGTEDGFEIWDIEPLRPRLQRDMKGSIGIVELYSRSNMLALVGANPMPALPTTKVSVWDDHRSMVVAEIDFKTQIKGVRVKKDLLVVALPSRIYIYKFTTLELLFSYDTCSNPKGILSICDTNCVATLGMKTGYVHLSKAGISSYFKAHESPITCISLSFDGTKVATASEHGTLIRVFDTTTGERIANFRRGTTEAKIDSITWSKDSRSLCVSSNKGTMHIFSFGKNPTSYLNFTSGLGILPGTVEDYANSEFSFVKIHYLSPKGIAVFGKEEGTINYISKDRFLSRCKYTNESGELVERVEL